MFKYNVLCRVPRGARKFDVGARGAAFVVAAMARSRRRRGKVGSAGLAAAVFVAGVILGAAVPASQAAGPESGLVLVLQKKAGGKAWNARNYFWNEHEEIAFVKELLGRIKQRTKTRQISGGENLNVMEWTTEKGPRPTMAGAVIYFKLFRSAFKYFNSRFGKFLKEPPEDWDDYGKYQEPAKKLSNGNINFVNGMIIDIFKWFAPKQKLIGNQGGILILFSSRGRNGSMVAFADPNAYETHNVAGLLTRRSNAKRVILSEDVFFLPPGADEFIRAVFEHQDGPIKIEVPYILYEVSR